MAMALRSGSIADGLLTSKRNFLGLLISSPTSSPPYKRPISTALSPRNELNTNDNEDDKKKGRDDEAPSVSLRLDDVNPVGLGRKSRQIFDEVWRKFSGLGQISRTPTDEMLDSVMIRGPMCEFTIPGAQDTTVLVVGATSRIGRIVVRKLMLRGYNVKVIFCFSSN